MELFITGEWDDVVGRIHEVNHGCVLYVNTICIQVLERLALHNE